MRLAIGLTGPMMEKWRAELMAEKDQLTFLIRLGGPMKGNILLNAFKISWEYFPSFVWLT